MAPFSERRGMGTPPDALKQMFDAGYQEERQSSIVPSNQVQLRHDL